MKYQVMKRCVISGSTWNVGDVVEAGKDVNEMDIDGLIGIGRIVPFDETRSVDRSIGLNDEPIPKRAPRKKKAK
jgi:hypothetical protein|tara:strand:- start:1957 stop:2178 length:222 start_codon:yes stop_codon:yes gene_type:complete